MLGHATVSPQSVLSPRLGASTFGKLTIVREMGSFEPTPIMYRGRFAVLWHRWILASGKDDSHWDLLLELDSGKLLTWRIAQFPFLNFGGSAGMEIARFAPTKADAANCIPTIRLPDHRAIYLDYEGPIDQDRGHVTRRAGGDYRAYLIDMPANDQALPAEHYSFSELDNSPGKPLPAALTLNGILQVKLDSPELRAELRIELNRIAESAALQVVGY